jgi:hypothetical protein
MHFRSKIGHLALVLIIFSSCYRKTTCPAFQSKYILDEDVLNQKYSLFDGDSNPKKGIGDVKKNKNGIHANRSYQVKYNEIKTVEMVTVYPDNQNMTLLASVSRDSLMVDSVMTPSSRYLTTFNNDQLIYNTLFGSLRKPKSDGMELFKDDLKVENAENVEPEEEKVGFFKRLFGNKNKKRREVKKVEKAEFGDPYEEDLAPVEEK